MGKLTHEQVKSIRKQAYFSQRKLARLYGVSQAMICYILNNKKRVVIPKDNKTKNSLAK